MALLTS
ncbi:hypothetical protein D018_1100A, partial [Vibrio parahaemolyticus VP2007-007]